MSSDSQGFRADLSASIFVAGHKGLVGSAIVRRLSELGYANILTRTRAELDLLDQQAVSEFFKEQKPDYVFLAAARVGGILANNSFPSSFSLTTWRFKTT